MVNLPVKTLVFFIDEIRAVIQVQLNQLDATKDSLKIACLKRLTEQFSDYWAEKNLEIEALLI